MIYSTIDMVQLTCAEEGCEEKAWSVVPLEGWKCADHKVVDTAAEEQNFVEKEEESHHG